MRPPTHTDPVSLGDLMHKAFRGLRRKWVLQLEPFGLTPHQARALGALAQHSEHSGAKPAVQEPTHPRMEGLRLKDLAEILKIAPRSATEVVDLLQEKGLVQRTPDPLDRRATLIALTAQGSELREQVLKDRRRAADEHFSRLSPQDQADLERLLRLLLPESQQNS